MTSPSLPRAYPLVPARASGCVVEDVDGNLLLDFNAGIAVTSTGHAHPTVVEAIRRQAGELLHFSASDFYLPVYVELCERLAALFPGRRPARVFLTNSGTEAVEAAIKLARWHTGRQYVIAFFNSFHGRSYGSVSLTASKARYRARFGPLLPGVLHAPYADSFRPNLGESEWSFPTSSYLEGVLFERLVEPQEVAAIVVEPIQGEGGYVVPPPGWLASLRELCDRHGILLVADEVQSGVGRTGSMWAIEREGVEPDILIAGKGLASGMPLGAMLAREDVATWTPGTHGSTYGGNPVACAAALATLDLVEAGLADRAASVGGRLLAGLRELARTTPGDPRRARRRPDGRRRADRPRHGRRRRAGLLPARPARALLLAMPRSACRRRSSSSDDQVDRALAIFGDACAVALGGHEGAGRVFGERVAGRCVRAGARAAAQLAVGAAAAAAAELGRANAQQGRMLAVDLDDVVLHDVAERQRQEPGRCDLAVVRDEDDPPAVARALRLRPRRRGGLAELGAKPGGEPLVERAEPVARLDVACRPARPCAAATMRRKNGASTVRTTKP